MEILSKLNEEQRLPVMQTEGAVLVTAGAGSGKTRLLTHRIAYLIDVLNVPAYNILAITFTNKAANEMKYRVEKLVPDASGIWIMTFHAMCVKIIKEFGYHIGFSRYFSIYGDSEKEKALKLILTELGIDEPSKRKLAGWHISNAKNQNLSPSEYLKVNSYAQNIELFCDIYARYQDYLAQNNALDFDDLLTKTYELLTTCEQAREYYQEKFHYIHIDEFQDTNTVQYDIAKILAGKYGNIFVVGDEDQSIYGWRGANIQNIFDFKEDFKNVSVFKLQQNYRSSKNIINLANQVIKNNSQRLDKELWTDNEEGAKVDVFVGNDGLDEAEYVARNIVRLRDFGVKLSDIAVLVRLNALTRNVEDRLLNYNINYRMLGGLKFYDRAEVKNVLSYIKLICNNKDNDCFQRIVNFPKRGIGTATIESLIKIARENNLSCMELLLAPNCKDILPPQMFKKLQPFADLISGLMQVQDTLSPTEFIIKIINDAQIRSAYMEDTEENINRLKNIDSLLVSVNEYFTNNPDHAIDDYIQSISLISDIDNYDAENDGVLIATVHAVKGLEFKVVFVIGLEEGNFPITRSSDSENDIEEERRLLYVAITRAKEKLFLSRARSRFTYERMDNLLPSRFFAEMQNCKSIDSKYFKAPNPAQTNAFSNHNNYNKQSTINSFIARERERQQISSEFNVGDKVEHPKFGVGVIIEIKNVANNRIASVDFEDFGVKNLALALAPLTKMD